MKAYKQRQSDTVYAEILVGRIFGVFTLLTYLAELNLASCESKKTLIQTVVGNYYEIWINYKNVHVIVFLYILVLRDVSSYELGLSIKTHKAVNVCSPKTTLSN